MSNDATELLDRAKTNSGSDYKTAKLLGVTTSQISNWRHGRAGIPVADTVLLAEVAGLDPQAWAARAIVAQYEGTPKGDKLYRALGKALAATGAALVSSGVSAHPIFSIAEKGVTYFIRCIEVLTERRAHARR